MGSSTNFQLAMGAMQYKQQGAIGKFNQSVANRNAQVLEGQATQIEQKAEFDIAQFQKDFKKLKVKLLLHLQNLV
jgi:hypothetical protein